MQLHCRVLNQAELLLQSSGKCSVLSNQIHHILYLYCLTKDQVTEVDIQSVIKHCSVWYGGHDSSMNRNFNKEKEREEEKKKVYQSDNTPAYSPGRKFTVMSSLVKYKNTLSDIYSFQFKHEIRRFWWSEVKGWGLTSQYTGLVSVMWYSTSQPPQQRFFNSQNMLH